MLAGQVGRAIEDLSRPDLSRPDLSRPDLRGEIGAVRTRP